MKIRLALLSLVWLGIAVCLGGASGQIADKPPSTEKASREEIDKLIAQLKGDRFKEREEATRRLMELDEALPALREAAKSDDAEVVRRAKQAIDAINKRLAKRAIGRAITLLKKGQTDRFVEQIVPWREYVDEECWKAAVDHVKTIADEASKMSGGHFKLGKNLPKILTRVKAPLPWDGVAKLRFVHADHLKTSKGLGMKSERIIAESVTATDGFIHESFLVCNGPVELKYSLANSVIFANGDLDLGDSEKLALIGGCIIICDGNIKKAVFIHDSVILCTGNVRVEADIKDSVIVSGGDVKLGLSFSDSSAKNSVIQEHQRDPLKLVHFFDPAQAGIEVKSTKDGVRVDALAAAKSFARAGVRQGDQLVILDGVKIDSEETFRRLLRRRMQELKPIHLEIRRGGKPMRFEVRVADDTP